MIKIGITGQAGFIGTHLFNFLSLKKHLYTLVPFRDEYFENHTHLKKFIAQCDCIVHLAAINRHSDSSFLYTKNIELVDKLIEALKEVGSKAYIIFASSTQEEKENYYGKSKKVGREKLIEWSEKNGNGFTGLIIPNVYGPFGLPFYNSVIATFCHQIVFDEKPIIESDAELKLIYINELLKIFENKIQNNTVSIERSVIAPHTYLSRVSDLLIKLNVFNDQYIKRGIIPELDSSFALNLFNTFRSYIEHKRFFPIRYKLNNDERGKFVELLKIHTGSQISYSSTKPGITRGNHFHIRKIERFAVIKGDALIRLKKYRTNDVIKFNVTGDDPSYVDIPIWYSHNITNTGDGELLTIFSTNEFYNPDDPDTYYEEV